MDRLSVLIASKDAAWRKDMSRLLVSEYKLIQKEDNPANEDLCLCGECHPPDVVVWHLLHLSDPESQAAYANLGIWARSTQFIVVDTSGAIENSFAGITIPKPCTVLSCCATLVEIAQAVRDAATRCRWNELRHLQIPACDVSTGGRILRANDRMLRDFGTLSGYPHFRTIVEGIHLRNPEEAGLPSSHPIQRVTTTRKACADVVPTAKGQVHLVCLPNVIVGDSLQTINVLLPDSGRRAKVFDLVRQAESRDLQGIYEYTVDAVTDMGFPRVRLYRFDKERKLFHGVASRGFDDKKRQQYFENRFRIPVLLDEPSADIVANRLPAVCIHDPTGAHSDQRSPFVRTYSRKRRAFARLLELKKAKKWIEAPLLFPGTHEVIGKIVADKGDDSDLLSVPDALDLGFLGMMAASVIFAALEIQQKHAHSNLVQVIHDQLPRIALERNEKILYRLIAAILSCEYGLRWEQVLLFIADSAGLKHATCKMALGGHPKVQREEIRKRFHSLHEYLEDAVDYPEPKDDRLYELFVWQREGDERHREKGEWEGEKDEERLLRFDHPEFQGKLAQLLAAPTNREWQEIVIAEDPWCCRIHENMPSLFPGERFYAYPLTKSFAADMEVDSMATANQPVGIAVLGMTERESRVDQHRLAITRSVLDLVGPLIAQRWTSQRMYGLFGALQSFNHCPLSRSWESVKAALDESIKRPDDDDVRKMLECWMSKHDKDVSQIHLAQSTIQTLGRVETRDIEVARCLAVYADDWCSEWGRGHSSCQLRLTLGGDFEELHLDCHPVVFRDAMTCLVRNAVEAAKRRERHQVRVEISVGMFADSDDCVEIVVRDDAGGVAPAIVPFLFVKGKSTNPNGLGRGLALARAALLMYNGDLQYDPLFPAEGATFRVVLHKRKASVPVQAERP